MTAKAAAHTVVEDEVRILGAINIWRSDFEAMS